MPEFPEDADLIWRAETAATGATIHNIRNLIGAYRGGLLGANNVSGKPAKRLYFLAYAETMARRLEAYIAHGDYRKANNEYPLPHEPIDRASTAAEIAEFHRWNLYAAKQWMHDIGKTEFAEQLRPMIREALDRS